MNRRKPEQNQLARAIYLDYHATTPCDTRVLNAMLPYFIEKFGNPSSSLHPCGQEAAEAVEKARMQISGIMGAMPEEIIFTAGATESNNLALQGFARAYRGKRNEIVTTPIEHKSVLNVCHELGYTIKLLPVDRTGLVDLESARKVITNRTLVVSVQAANNEIGTLQPIPQIVEMAHDRGAVVHCDAAQAVGKIPVNVRMWGIDLLSVSSHKLYGPKGVGALFINDGPHSFPLKPLLIGGGQEHNLRSGTLNVPGIVGFGEACAISSKELPKEASHISSLRDLFEENLYSQIDNMQINGAISNRLPGNSSLTFPRIEAEAMIVNMPQLILSTGSACASGAPEPSHVLLAIGLSREDAYSTIRVGLGRFTTRSEVEQASSIISEAVSSFSALN
ncbi:MAG: cysteine desulfurase [Thaumarchaeota archaeon]|nr:cysteine desulfurase [Nitrososphaerota archaeon]